MGELGGGEEAIQLGSPERLVVPPRAERRYGYGLTLLLDPAEPRPPGGAKLKKQ